MIIANVGYLLNIHLHLSFLERRRKKRKGRESKRKVKRERDRGGERKEEKEERRAILISMSPAKWFCCPDSVLGKNSCMASFSLQKTALETSIPYLPYGHGVCHVHLLCSPTVSLSSSTWFPLANRMIFANSQHWSPDTFHVSVYLLTFTFLLYLK